MPYRLPLNTVVDMITFNKDQLLDAFIFVYCIHSVDKLETGTYLNDAKKDSKPALYLKGADCNFFEIKVF